ncbi:MAG: PEP-CTERM sorting domain-containing protein [Alphaproteobacteria bacterium]
MNRDETSRSITDRARGSVSALVAAIALATLVFHASAPAARAGSAPRSRVVSVDFARGAQGWEGDFADYPDGSEAFYELEAGMAPLPDGLRGGASALRLRGNNHSDDLFLFARGPVDGLVPGARYAVRVDLVLASNSPAGAIGIGGAPGESVYVKAGALGVEPVTLVDRGFVLLDADKGNQSVGGVDASVVGDLAVKTPIEAPRFLLKRYPWRKLPALEVTADGAGRAWLFAGADSGFEGPTTVYLVRVKARFVRVD